jgi:glutamate 5-kinase
MANNSSTSEYKRIVVKLGTKLLTGGGSQLNQEIMSQLVAQVAELRRQGREILIVSSGAMAYGRHKLGLTQKLKGIPYKQVLCSVGQSRLMYAYEQLFGEHDITVAQALLTKADLSDRAGYLNARNTLLALLELGVVPIVNENDVVAVDELDGAKFGDNDNLSAMVANLIDADLLLLLTDIAGLYTADPRLNADARLIPVIEKIDEKVEQLASGTTSQSAVGGMITKIEAARLATASGVTVVIADGKEKDVIVRLVNSEAIGTRFLPTATHLESRKRWMLCGLCVKGRIVIDPGAAEALRQKGGSLLPAGIKEVDGSFDRGDIVDIFDIEGNHIASGIVNFCSADIDKIKGMQSRKIDSILGTDFGPEVVHRNNLAIF